MLNAILLLEGYAVQVVFKPNVKYINYFSGYETEAWEKGKGLWDLMNVICDTGTADCVVIRILSQNNSFPGKYRGLHHQR